MEGNKDFWRFVGNVEFLLDSAKMIDDPFERLRYLEEDIVIPPYNIFGNLSYEERSFLFSLSRILIWEMIETKSAIIDTVLSAEEIQRNREEFFERLTKIRIPKD